MELTGLHHIAIISSKEREMLAFYRDKLGFQVTKEVHRPERGDSLWMLNKGSITLELFVRPDAPSRVNNPEALGLRHLAFHVKDMEETCRWLNAMGIETEPVRWDAINGGRFTFFKDPDGLPLELHE